jgi:cysteine-S-conjugate beta-lyase
MTRKYDFETVIERRGTGCVKWDAWEAYGHSQDDLPLWVADMDFKTAPCAIEALTHRVQHGIFGYTMAPEGYYEAVLGWFETRHGWRPQREWLVMTPGVVFALAMAVTALTQPGDAVIIQPPVYYPFRSEIEGNGRRVVTSPLIYQDGRYTMDYEGFERAVEESGARLFILCNPHNPVGRAWTEEELRRIGQICLRHNVVVISDEIHADFARAGHTHVPFASLGGEFANNAIVCTAPSKTFNLAGLQLSNIFIPNPDIRAAFKRALDRTGYDEPSVFGITAAQACYERGGEWLDELKQVLDENYAVLEQAVGRMPGVRLVPLESTYLPWLDCRGLGLDDEALRQLVEHDAHLWLDLGTMFGREGSGFVRMNLASPKPIIEEACKRLAGAVEKLGK